MLNKASQTNRLSGRAQITLETKTEPITKTPPMVGVPCFGPCNSASRLADFEPKQLDDDVFAEGEAQDERGDGGGYGSECNVKKYVETDELITQAMQIVHHGE